MPSNVTFNGTTYAVPDAGAYNWQVLSSFLLDIGTNAGLKTIDQNAIRVATTTPVTVSSSTDCAIVTNLTVAGAVAVNLPAGINGQVFVIVDGKNDAATNNITITPNGAETINGAATLVLAQNRQSVILQYSTTGTQWRVLGSYFTTLANAFANPMTTAGDITYGGASGLPTRLAKGAANTVLIAGTTPSYALVANANVDSAAAIAGTKISPDFGSQNVVTTGTVTGTKVYSYGSPSQTNGSASTIYARASTSSSNMFTLGNTTGGDGFSLIYNPSDGTTKMATNGTAPSSSPALTIEADADVLIPAQLGVGTTPSYPFDVTKAGGANFIAHFKNTTNATPYTLHVEEPASAGGGYPLLTVTNSGGGTSYLRVDSGGSITMSSLAGSGSRAVNASATGVLSAASDSRLKQEVKDAHIPGLKEVLQLEPVAYKWLSDIDKRGEDAAVEVGFFADKVNPIIPSAAPIGNDGYYGFYDRTVVAALVKSIQELTARIEALEGKN